MTVKKSTIIAVLILTILIGGQGMLVYLWWIDKIDHLVIALLPAIIVFVIFVTFVFVVKLFKFSFNG